MMCIKWKYGEGLCLTESDDMMIFYVRVTPLEATHFLFLLPAMGNTYTMDAELETFFFFWPVNGFA